MLSKQLSLAHSKLFPPPFTYPLPPIHPLFAPPHKARFDLTHRSCLWENMVMRCFPRPFPYPCSGPARYDGAHSRPRLYTMGPEIFSNRQIPSNSVKQAIGPNLVLSLIIKERSTEEGLRAVEGRWMDLTRQWRGYGLEKGASRLYAALKLLLRRPTSAAPALQWPDSSSGEGWRTTRARTARDHYVRDTDALSADPVDETFGF